jgi:hypothetical protein
MVSGNPTSVRLSTSLSRSHRPAFTGHRTSLSAGLGLPPRATWRLSTSSVGVAIQPPGLSNVLRARGPAPSNGPLTRPTRDNLALRARPQPLRAAAAAAHALRSPLRFQFIALKSSAVRYCLFTPRRPVPLRPAPSVCRLLLTAPRQSLTVCKSQPARRRRRQSIAPPAPHVPVCKDPGPPRAVSCARRALRLRPLGVASHRANSRHLALPQGA